MVPVRREDDHYRYLVLRAFNRWDFPKGIVEESEDPVATARREVEEETGITDLDFRWGYEFYPTGPYGPGKVARYYLALTTGQKEIQLPISPELGKPEHHEFRWVSYEEGLCLLGKRVIPVLEWAHRLTGSK